MQNSSPNSQISQSHSTTSIPLPSISNSSFCFYFIFGFWNVIPFEFRSSLRLILFQYFVLKILNKCRWLHETNDFQFAFSIVRTKLTTTMRTIATTKMSMVRLHLTKATAAQTHSPTPVSPALVRPTQPASVARPTGSEHIERVTILVIIYWMERDQLKEGEGHKLLESHRKLLKMI